MMNVYYFHHQADELLGTASEQFLGKSVKEIKQTILQTLEGHLRAILGEYGINIGYIYEHKVLGYREVSLVLLHCSKFLWVSLININIDTTRW